MLVHADCYNLPETLDKAAGAISIPSVIMHYEPSPEILSRTQIIIK